MHEEPLLLKSERESRTKLPGHALAAGVHLFMFCAGVSVLVCESIPALRPAANWVIPSFIAILVLWRPVILPTVRRINRMTESVVNPPSPPDSDAQ